MTTSHMKMLLVALVPVRNFCAFAGRCIAMDQSADRIATLALPVSVAVECHSAHRFSRWVGGQRYRKVISTIGMV